MNQPATFLEIKQWLAKAQNGDATVDWSLMEPYWQWIDEELNKGKTTELSYYRAVASLQSEFKNLVPPTSVSFRNAKEKVRLGRLQENGAKAT